MKRRNLVINKYLLFLVFFVLGNGVGFLISFLSALNPSWIPLVSAILGLFVAFIVPIWQALFVNAPKLSVEINSIRRNVSESAKIKVDDYPELTVLLPSRRSNSYLYSYLIDENPLIKVVLDSEKANISIDELDQLINSAKQVFRDLPKQIEERKKDQDRIAGLTPTTFTKYECDRLNQPLDPEIDFDSENIEKNLEDFRDVYKKRVEEVEKRYSDLQTGIPGAERKVEQLKNELIDNRSVFIVSISLINSGRSNTAIKIPALMRVSIGEGNYIDIKLTLKDFENKSEVLASGTRIVTFESPEISSLPEEDRKLINTYWGQSVNAYLLFEDIHSKIYITNKIAFAEGLYQKIIYDRLARTASAVK